MNYLLYGPDTYRSRRKLNEIIAEYRRKNGGSVNLHRFDAQEDDLASLLVVAGGNSLFGSKKLLVLERPFSAGRQFEFVRETLADNRANGNSLIMVWDETLEDEAKARVSEAAAYFDKTQEFRTLHGIALNRWIREEAASQGIALSPTEIMLLASKGGDLWALSNELEKLAIGGRGPGRDQAVGESIIFDLGDTFFSAPQRALGHLLSLFAQGEEEGRIFSYLSNYARTLLMMKSYLDLRRTIPASAKIHPFVIRKASAQVRTLSLGDLARNLSSFLRADLEIKIGASRPKDSLLRLLFGGDIMRL